MSSAAEVRHAHTMLVRPANAGPIVVAMKPLAEPSGTLSLAEWLAVREARPLHVVSVVDALQGEEFTARHFLEQRQARIAGRIFEMLEHAGFGRLPVRVEVVEGVPEEAIDRIVRERAAPLLVIGMGHPAEPEAGAIAHQVLRAARVPVLLVPPTADARPFRRAVAAVDFSDASVRAAAHVLPLLAEGASLTLCHVRTPRPMRDDDAASADATYALQCEESFGRLIRALPVPAGIAVTTTLLHGDPATCLIAHAKETGADIISCGRRNDVAAGRPWMGSVSAGLVRRVHVPVLVMPDADDGAAPAADAAR